MRSHSCFAARNTPVTNLEDILLATLAVPPSGGTITRRFAPRKGMPMPKRSFLSVPHLVLKTTISINLRNCTMIIGAMDILYSGNVDGFVLVSSDSDFTRLAARLRESGMTVIGMCEHKTPVPFVRACTEVKYLDMIEQTVHPVVVVDEKPTVKRKKKNDPSNVYKKAIDKILEENSDEEGWVKLSLIGNRLKSQYPEFDPKNYGYRKTADYIKVLGYATREEPDLNNKQSTNGVLVYIRKKTKKK